MSFTPEALHTNYTWFAHLDDATLHALHPSLRMLVPPERIRREKRGPVWRYVSEEERRGLWIRVELATMGEREGGGNLVAEVRGVEQGMEGNLAVEFELYFFEVGRERVEVPGWAEYDAFEGLKASRGKVKVTVTFGNLPKRGGATLGVNDPPSGEEGVWNKELCRRLLEREKLWRIPLLGKHAQRRISRSHQQDRSLLFREDCEHAMHLVRVGEASLEDYRDVLVWLRTGHLVGFGSDEPDQFEEVGASSSFEERVIEMKLATLAKCSGMYRLAHALELEPLRFEMLGLLRAQIEAGFGLDVLFDELPLEHDEVAGMLIEQLVDRRDWIEGMDEFKIVQERFESGEMGEAGTCAFELLGIRFESEKEVVEREKESRELRLIR
ncbi:BQ2448_1074 [Microbotryum intermedium]|uniref:BQ2448_1074 protein n=1 Tax=Microbotryum intermedium TaxID=269621 RepID=A0A238F750_9BASI|nr:BQ2448_1074 [Microbotryum intermedium]